MDGKGCKESLHEWIISRGYAEIEPAVSSESKRSVETIVDRLTFEGIQLGDIEGAILVPAKFVQGSKAYKKLEEKNNTNEYGTSVYAVYLPER